MGLLALNHTQLLKVGLHESLGHDLYTALELAGKLGCVMHAIRADLERSLLYGAATGKWA